MKHQNYTVIKASGSNPDPATYCPANGYYDPTVPIPYIPDPNMPVATVNDGEIVLMMIDSLDKAINTYVTINNATKARYSIYGADDTLIYTVDVNNNTTFFYQFPTTGGIELANGYHAFKVVIKAATTGSITHFKFMTKSGYAASGWPVIEAHIKCPSLTTLYQAFLNQKIFEYLKFYGDHNNLTNINAITSGCDLIRGFKAGVQMNALTDMGSFILNDSLLEDISLPTTFDNLQNLQSAFRGSGIKTFNFFPATLPAVTNAREMLYSCKNLIGSIEIPSMPNCVDMVYVASQCPKTTKTTFLGNYIPNTSSAISSFQGCTMLKEVDMGGDWGKTGVVWSLSYIFEACPSLKKITLPSKFISLGPPTMNHAFAQNLNTSVEEITTSDWSESPQIAMQLNMLSVKIFNQPTLKVYVFTVGANSSRPSALETLELNWANCLPLAQNVTINCLFCNFSQTELERIYTALPDISTGYSYTGTLKFYGSPGYDASNKTIATAKGWIFATT